MMRDIGQILDRLSKSTFRQRFKLGAKEQTYLRTKGRDVVREHARSFIATRLAPAHPRNDGKQTPMRGHPVFVAQHATATCCRGCLAKWHGMAMHAAFRTRSGSRTRRHRNLAGRGNTEG